MDSGFHNTTPWHWIQETSILDYNYGWIPDPISWIPDSKAVDSGFRRPKLPGFRIPDSGLPYIGRVVSWWTVSVHCFENGCMKAIFVQRSVRCAPKAKKIHSQLFLLCSNGKPPQILLWSEALFFVPRSAIFYQSLDLCMMQIQVLELDWNEVE